MNLCKTEVRKVGQDALSAALRSLMVEGEVKLLCQVQPVNYEAILLLAAFMEKDEAVLVTNRTLIESAIRVMRKDINLSVQEDEMTGDIEIRFSEE
jgi:hypothetical protein